MTNHERPESPAHPPAAEASAWAEVRDGVRDILAPLIAAIPIGLLFGAVATAKGLSVLEVGLMCALVFAGGSQFAALELWGYPVPVVALVASTLLINLRHVLMGASLAPRTGAFRRWQRLLGFAVLADENWAFTERRARRRPLTPAYFGAMGAVFYLNWVVWSVLGGLVGTLIGDPRAIGADFAFTALFIGIVAGMWRGRATAIPVLASAAVGALAYRLLGPPWHVAFGAAAGIAAAALAVPAREAAPIREAAR